MGYTSRQLSRIITPPPGKSYGSRPHAHVSHGRRGQLIDVLQLRASLLARLPLERLRALLRPRVLRVIRHAEHARNITDQLLYGRAAA